MGFSGSQRLPSCLFPLTFHSITISPLENLFPGNLNEKSDDNLKKKRKDLSHKQNMQVMQQSHARNGLATVTSLTCKLEAGSAAQDGPPRVESRALVHTGVLVLVQVTNDQAAPRHVTPVVAPQINECSV